MKPTREYQEWTLRVLSLPSPSSISLPLSLPSLSLSLMLAVEGVSTQLLLWPPCLLRRGTISSNKPFLP